MKEVVAAMSFGLAHLHTEGEPLVGQSLQTQHILHGSYRRATFNQANRLLHKPPRAANHGVPGSSLCSGTRGWNFVHNTRRDLANESPSFGEKSGWSLFSAPCQQVTADQMAHMDKLIGVK